MGKRISFTIMALVLPCTFLGAQEDSGQADFEQGEALLREGQFEPALKAYQSAVTADPTNAAWTARLGIVRRVVRVQELARNEDDSRWARAVKVLHEFYLQNGIAAEARPLDERYHAREQTEESGLQLLETLMALGANEPALALYDGVLGESQSPQIGLLKGIVLARLGQSAEAAAMLEDAPAELATCSALYNRACLNSRLGNVDAARADLRLALQRTPVKYVADTRKAARTDDDLARLRSADGFEELLATESMVAEAAAAGCGGGCGGCKMKTGEGGCKLKEGEGGCKMKEGEGGCKMKEGQGCDKEGARPCPDHEK